MNIAVESGQAILNVVLEVEFVFCVLNLWCLNFHVVMDRGLNDKVGSEVCTFIVGIGWNILNVIKCCMFYAIMK